MIELTPELVSTLGFPIAITGFLLWERVNVTQANIKAINELREVLIQIKAVMEVKK